MAQKIEIIVHDDNFNLSGVLTALQSVLDLAADMEYSRVEDGRFSITAEGYADGVYGAGAGDAGWARRVGDRWVC